MFDGVRSVMVFALDPQASARWWAAFLRTDVQMDGSFAWLEVAGTELGFHPADDERNPPETGIMDRDMKRLKNGKLYLIPASNETRGHLTTGGAKLYTQQLKEFLETAPQRAM